ncbi:MAG TPA: hypothetical protein VN831_29345 [Bradyrhizobium sp.]|nr:hypothetical protein [Bradyrhizobium sp.]
MITAEKCRMRAAECRVLASSIDIPAQRSLEQSIMALNWEALANLIDHDNSQATATVFVCIKSLREGRPEGLWKYAEILFYGPSR